MAERTDKWAPNLQSSWVRRRRVQDGDILAVLTCHPAALSTLEGAPSADQHNHRHETLAVAIPRGNYMPVFDWRRPGSSPAHPIVAVGGPVSGMLSSSVGDSAIVPTSLPSLPGDTSWGLQSSKPRWPWVIAAITLRGHALDGMDFVYRHEVAGRKAPTYGYGVLVRFARGNQTDIVLPDESISMMEDPPEASEATQRLSRS